MNTHKNMFRPGRDKTTANPAFRARRNRGNTPAPGRPEKLTPRQNLVKYTLYLLIFSIAAGSGWLFMSSLEQQPRQSLPWRACLLEQTDGTLLPEMTPIPADNFTLNPDHTDIAPFLEPQGLTRVVIDQPFLIQNQEVSRGFFEQYATFLDNMTDTRERERLKTRLGFNWKQGDANSTRIQGISWEAAWDFSNWLSQRTGCHYDVPSREEWAAAVMHLRRTDGKKVSKDDHTPLRSLLWGNREWTRSECDMGHHLVGAEDWIAPINAGQPVCMPPLFSVAGFRVVLTPSHADTKQVNEVRLEGQGNGTGGNR